MLTFIFSIRRRLVGVPTISNIVPILDSIEEAATGRAWHLPLKLHMAPSAGVACNGGPRSDDELSSLSAWASPEEDPASLKENLPAPPPRSSKSSLQGTAAKALTPPRRKKAPTSNAK